MTTPVILGAVLAVCVALESTLIKWVNLHAVQLPSEEMVIGVEVIKGLVSLFIYSVWRLGAVSLDGERRPLVRVSSPTSPLSAYLVPSFLYTISNNVTFLALERITPAYFNLLMNLKIPMTALLAWLFLDYKIHAKMAVSFLLLTLGACVASLPKDTLDGIIGYQEPTPIDGIAICLMAVYSLCSAGGAVSTEFITRREYASENMFIQNVKFCTCGLLCNLAVVAVKLATGTSLENYTRVHWLHLLAICGLVANGLMTGLVIKYAGSILKTYAVAVALFLSAFLTWYVFEVTLGAPFYWGATTCFLAILLYAQSRSEV